MQCTAHQMNPHLWNEHEKSSTTSPTAPPPKRALTISVAYACLPLADENARALAGLSTVVELTELADRARVKGTAAAEAPLPRPDAADDVTLDELIPPADCDDVGQGKKT